LLEAHHGQDATVGTVAEIYVELVSFLVLFLEFKALGPFPVLGACIFSSIL
jgi:hypothetical protein